jgi:hypothetical protein
MDHEGTGVNVAYWINQTHHSACATKVQPIERLSKCREVKKRVTSEDLGVIKEPCIKFALLNCGGVELIPCVNTSSRRTKASQTKLCTVSIGEILELLNLGNILPRHDHRNLELSKIRFRKIIHSSRRSSE